MDGNILIHLRTQLGHFSNTEKKIAAVILDDPRSFTGFTLSEMADKSGVSQGSIINFSRKYAGGGYPNLKLKVSASLHTDDPQPLSVVESGDSIKEALDKNVQSHTRAFEITSQVNSESALQQAAERILNARKVEIYGVYRSAVVATDLYFQLLNLGISVSFVSDILTCAVSASMLDSDCLVIAISSSGNTREIVNAVKNARDRGATVLCLTSNINSPLAKLSDNVLIAASSGQSVTGNAMEIRSSQLLLADTLCSYLVSKMDEIGKNRFMELNAILKTFRVND